MLAIFHKNCSRIDSRGDWGTTKRKNRHIQNPVGYIRATDEHFQKCVTLHFLTKQIFKKVSQCTPYSGTLRHHMGYLETPNYVPENNVDLTKIKIWRLHIPVAKACSWLMLDVAVKCVPEKIRGHLETLSGHLETDLGHRETVSGHIETASDLTSDIIVCVWDVAYLNQTIIPKL